MVDLVQVVDKRESGGDGCACKVRLDVTEGVWIDIRISYVLFAFGPQGGTVKEDSTTMDTTMVASMRRGVVKAD